MFTRWIEIFGAKKLVPVYGIIERPMPLQSLHIVIFGCLRKCLNATHPIP